MAIRTDNPGRPQGQEGVEMLERMNKNHAPLRDFALPHIDYTDNMRILDAGCGGGATIAQMLDICDQQNLKGVQIDGIDYQQESIDTASRYNERELGRRVNLKKANVMHLPIGEGTYDLVTAVETVYFWPDIKTSFGEALRVLKENGTFAVINEGSNPDNHPDWPDPDQTMHIYRPEELRAFMESVGFRKVSVVHGEGEHILVRGTK